jgi:hypothetical protein
VYMMIIDEFNKYALDKQIIDICCTE